MDRRGVAGGGYKTCVAGVVRDDLGPRGAALPPVKYGEISPLGILGCFVGRGCNLTAAGDGPSKPVLGGCPRRECLGGWPRMDFLMRVGHLDVAAEGGCVDGDGVEELVWELEVVRD